MESKKNIGKERRDKMGSDEKQFSGLNMFPFNDLDRGPALFENSLVATFLSKTDGTILKANQAACKLFGYSETELIQIGRTGIIDHDDDNIKEALRKRSSSGFCKSVLTGIKKTGLRFPLECTSTIFHEINGEELAYTMINDISDKKTNTPEVEINNERFELIARAANDALWEHNLVTNELWANSIHQQLYGLTLADAVPDNDEWISRLHPSERNSVVNGFQESLDSDSNIWFAEYRFKSTDRGWLNIYSRAYIERNEEGKVIRLVGSMMDITKQKREESQLKLLESVITNTKDAVMITEAEPFDAPGPGIVFVNKAFTTMTGYTAEEVIGKTPRILQGPKTDKAELKKLGEALRRWESCEITVVNYRKNGEEFWMNMSISPVADANGWFTHWISIERDVTERVLSEIKLKELNKHLQKQALQLKASNEELEQFAYVASHDLQEPLRMVTGFLSQLERKYNPLIDENGKKYIYYAVDGAKRMQQIILDLLEYSRVGRAGDKLEKIDLNEMIREVEVLLKKKIQEKSATIEVAELPVIYAAKSPIRQVFQNLIGNALKYSKADVAVKINIAVTEFNDQWQFSISDNGIGISPEYFHKIFVIFQRLHNRDAYSGSGIGLAVTKKVIEKMGGTIWVESELDKGSCFYFTIGKSPDYIK
jgi:PAS domain S-box-containing protein